MDDYFKLLYICTTYIIFLLSCIASVHMYVRMYRVWVCVCVCVYLFDTVMQCVGEVCVYYVRIGACGRVYLFNAAHTHTHTHTHTHRNVMVKVEKRCQHNIVVFDMCADCGLNLRK